jgi:hypothetical protein
MGNLCAFLRDHRRAAALLLALTLVMKMLVPAGYMPGQGTKVLTVQVCADTLGKHVTTQIVIPQSGAPSESHGDHGKGDGACPFSALALLFILALGFAPQAPPLRERAQHLRPPLRGPPSFA